MGLHRDIMDAEVLAIWPDLPIVFRFILSTGQRIDDVIGLCWDQIDPETRLWTKPKKDHSDSHGLVLPSWVMTWLPAIADSNLVFLDKDSSPYTIKSLNKLFQTHLEQVGFGDLNLQDLRNYVLYQLTQFTDKSVAEDIINHNHPSTPIKNSSIDSESGYAELLELWNHRLQEIVLEGGSTIGDTPLSNSH